MVGLNQRARTGALSAVMSTVKLRLAVPVGDAYATNSVPFGVAADAT